MKYLTRFEKNIPVKTSVRAVRKSSSDVASHSSPTGFPFARRSSTFREACQKKRYGEMVMPKIPTKVARNRLDLSTRWKIVALKTDSQSGRARKAVMT
jgi:hypothetical protein